MESFLSTYGLAAVFIGMLIEGEILFISAVVLAKMGHFNLSSVLFAIYLGAVGHDWIFYLLGRTQEAYLFQKKPVLKQQVIQFFSPIERNPLLFFLFYRFMIGFRMIILSVFGIKGISIQKFLGVSLLANFLWVATYGFLGYFFADVIIENLEWLDTHKYFLIVGAFFVILLLQLRKRK